MNATRRLDILTIVGGVLAVVMLVAHVTFVLRTSAKCSVDGMRQTALRCMPTPDMRADMELADEQTSEHARSGKVLVSKLRKAVERYPDSARLQLRMGVATDDPQSYHALRQVVHLDPKNALPLYILASRASSKGRWDDAVSLLKQANDLDRIDWYPLPYDACSGDGAVEMMLVSANSSSMMNSIPIIRHVSNDLTEHASSLRAQGQTERALVILGQVSDAGWKLIRKDDASSLELLFGIAIVKKAHKYEREMYTETGNQPGLAQIAREDKELLRLRAGSMAYADLCMLSLVQRVGRFAALSIPISAAAETLAAVIVLSLLWTGILALRSRRIPGAELHHQATETAFSGARRAKLYALIFALMTAITVAGSSLDFSSADAFLWDSVGMAVGGVCAAGMILGILVWTATTYRRAFRSAVDTTGDVMTRPWRGYPIADKRERQRRLTGVMGGVMIVLALWSGALSAYMKTTMNAYPWQTERATAGLYQEEQEYVHDLVDGKIKVPEEYIKAEQKRQLDALRKTRSGERDK